MTTPPLEALDSVAARITELRAAIRQTLVDNDPDHARQLQRQLRAAETAWHTLLDTGPAGPFKHAKVPTGTATGFALSAREQAHRTLALLEFPNSPQKIAKAHNALFPGHLDLAKLSSLRRDEERSWRTTNGARPYYVTPALSADTLMPVRALLTISSWPLERRIVGPDSARADFLMSAERIAYAVAEIDDAHNNPDHPATQLLADLARALGVQLGHASPGAIIQAAEREYATIASKDRATRAAAAKRLVGKPLNVQLFGLAE